MAHRLIESFKKTDSEKQGKYNGTKIKIRHELHELTQIWMLILHGSPKTDKISALLQNHKKVIIR